MSIKINKIIILGVPFIFGIGAGWIVKGMHWDVFITSYIPSLATLVAAYCGAKYAFKFQNDKEIEDNKKRNLVNGNIAVFNMMRMICKLRNIQKHFIDPVRDLPVIFIQMQPTIPINNDIKLNIETLYFLLETDDNNLLVELVIEEESFLTALDAINERSRLHREEIQPLLEKAGIVQSCNYSIVNIENALGNRRYITIKQATTDSIMLVDSTIVSLKKVSYKLIESLNKHYKNEKIISF